MVRNFFHLNFDTYGAPYFSTGILYNLFLRPSVYLHFTNENITGILTSCSYSTGQFCGRCEIWSIQNTSVEYLHHVGF